MAMTNEWSICFRHLEDPSVSEIEANGPDLFFMKKSGKRIRLDIALRSEEEYLQGIEQSLVPQIRDVVQYERNSYLFEGPLYYHSPRGETIRGRCHIVLPPATDSPQVTIAKKSTSLTSLDSIAERGSMSYEMLNFLKVAIQSNLTITFSGGTGAGKALHKATKLPTPSGWRTVDEVQEGDLLYSEEGRPTRVLRKYCPRDPESFELTFKNGQKVKASAGHLWQVTELNKKVSFGPRRIPLFSEDSLALLHSTLEKTSPTDECSVKDICDLFSVSMNTALAKTAHNFVRSQRVVTKRELLLHLLEEHNARVAHSDILDLKLPYSRPTAVLSTKEMFITGVRNQKKRLNYAVEALSKEVEYPEAELLIPPYVLGAWLGDGLSDRGNICGVDKEVRDRVLEAYEMEWEAESFDPSSTQLLFDWKFPKLRQDLTKLSLLNNKHIPLEYIHSSRSQRIALISGLLDTDGTFSRDGFAEIGMTNEAVVRAAHEIVLSLGWKATKIRKKQGKYRGADGAFVLCKMVYSFSFIADELDIQVARKKEKFMGRESKTLQQQLRHSRDYIIDIQPVKDNADDYFCFEVDAPSHLFLCTESFIPTHNTTMLEACSKLIPDSVRIGVAEDTPELALTQPNVTYLHSVPWKPGMDPNKVATLSWVVQQFQRMRTDRLIIGETRGKEFADFLMAANSGMDGSMTTIHANSPVRCLDKMTNFALKGSEGQPIRAINTDIGNAIDLIVQLIILPDGRHKVDAIQEVTSTISNSEDARITTNPLYVYNPQDDSFVKKSFPTDALRIHFAEKNINIQEFLKTAPGERMPAHSSLRDEMGHQPQNRGGLPTSGLPRREV